jgi:hypothetical protein
MPTGHQQVNALQGSWWEVDIEVPQLNRAGADAVEAFLCSLNGQEGTFLYRDILRGSSKGSASGAWSVGAGCVANSTNLPTSGTGSLAVGDWIQVGTQLFRVLKVNSGSVDVFPRIRQAYAAGTQIIYTNAVGLFRQRQAPALPITNGKNFGPYSISIMEAF